MPIDPSTYPTALDWGENGTPQTPKELTRQTIADGLYIQNNTMFPNENRDEQLKDWIEETNDRITKLSGFSAARVGGTVIPGNQNISGTLSFITGANLSAVGNATDQSITIGLNDDIYLNGVNAANISGTNVSAANASATKLSAANLSATNVSANDIDVTDLSAANLSATNVSANDLSATNVSAWTLSAENMSANKVKFTELTVTYLSAQYTSAQIISAVSGLSAYGTAPTSLYGFTDVNIGNLTASGTANISGATTVNNNLTVTGNANVTGTLNVTGNANVTGTLDVTGASTFDSKSVNLYSATNDTSKHTFIEIVGDLTGKMASVRNYSSIATQTGTVTPANSADSLTFTTDTTNGNGYLKITAAESAPDTITFTTGTDFGNLVGSAVSGYVASGFINNNFSGTSAKYAVSATSAFKSLSANYSYWAPASDTRTDAANYRPVAFADGNWSTWKNSNGQFYSENVYDGNSTLMYNPGSDTLKVKAISATSAQFTEDIHINAGDGKKNVSLSATLARPQEDNRFGNAIISFYGIGGGAKAVAHAKCAVNGYSYGTGLGYSDHKEFYYELNVEDAGKDTAGWYPSWKYGGTSYKTAISKIVGQAIAFGCNNIAIRYENIKGYDGEAGHILSPTDIVIPLASMSKYKLYTLSLVPLGRNGDPENRPVNLIFDCNKNHFINFSDADYASHTYGYFYNVPTFGTTPPSDPVRSLYEIIDNGAGKAKTQGHAVTFKDCRSHNRLNFNYQMYLNDSWNDASAYKEENYIPYPKIAMQTIQPCSKTWYWNSHFYKQDGNTMEVEGAVGSYFMKGKMANWQPSKKDATKWSDYGEPFIFIRQVSFMKGANIHDGRFNHAQGQQVITIGNVDASKKSNYWMYGTNYAGTPISSFFDDDPDYAVSTSPDSNNNVYITGGYGDAETIYFFTNAMY